jgi:hypothetical protein
MKKSVLFLFIGFSFLNVYAQTVKYSPAWFGPNANPVPEFTDARISSKTTIGLMGDYYFGFGDKTKNVYFKVEIPFLSEQFSLKIWSAELEYYNVTEKVSNVRGMNGNTSGNAGGDFYVQTRLRMLKETKNLPNIIFNSTLKSASGTNFEQRRYFDTPGYYFDAEIGKSVNTKSNFISEIRCVANIGFFCWETTQSRQDDAPMYGGKIILANQKWKLENTLSGYYGWMHKSTAIVFPDYGDAPLVYAVKFTISKNKIDYFAQYQYGIKDFPYHQIRVGISFPINKLTPKY